ncbi:MAG: endolytic transglycosylase MltG [Candidatus Calescibacterium sp.]|nr:endolytic transglycosylase MltG [Candidatus Calescibacterium sp.]MCX7733223.1 endolytic transglycosylase MltG [bacterium]MDW8086930.1 endolytic transglycosylase MltG [Candidatus Calescibacterium sp.]
MKKGLLIFTFLFIVLFSALLAFFIYFDFHRKREIQKVLFEIKVGESLKSISERLEDLGIIRSSTIFYIFSRNHYKDFRAGEYLIEGFVSPSDLIDIFTKGPTVRRQITVVPCWTIYHIADELLNQNIIEDRNEFIRYSFDEDFLSSIGINFGSAEGFLYPDTYYFFKGTDPRDIITKMVENFFMKVGNERINLAENKLGLYTVLILASIVESEAHFEFEKPVIASVYLNRLKIGMPLQADPTVMYGLRIFDRPPLPSDLRKDNEYNTYTRRGLPPTPICNPLVSSIDAVLKPKKTNFLYFVARPDGTHFFSKTYDEHIQNIKRARAERNKEDLQDDQISSDLPMTQEK